jgi:hypothetical protein
LLIYIYIYNYSVRPIQVAAAVKAKHGRDFPGAVLQWEEFLNSAPDTDDAEEHVKDHPLYIPFSKELFGIDPESDRHVMSTDILTDFICVFNNDMFIYSDMRRKGIVVLRRRNNVSKTPQ